MGLNPFIHMFLIGVCTAAMGTGAFASGHGHVDAHTSAPHATNHAAAATPAHEAKHSIPSAEHGTPHAAHSKPKPAHGKQHTAHSAPSTPGFFAQLSHYFQSHFAHFLKKLEKAQNLDVETEFLQKRLAAVEMEKQELQHKLDTYRELMRAKNIMEAAEKEGGQVAARTMASLPEPNPELKKLPTQDLFEKGSEAFESQRYEVSAKIFLELEHRKDLSEKDKVQLHYLTAVNLYELGNYKMALDYFTATEKMARQKNGEIHFAPRCMMWRSVCLTKLGLKVQGAQALSQMMHEFPHSVEARRLKHGN